jgi:hypothetical protein
MFMTTGGCSGGFKAITLWSGGLASLIGRSLLKSTNSNKVESIEPLSKKIMIPGSAWERKLV